MNRSVRFVVSVFLLAFAMVGADWLTSSPAQGTGYRDSVLARQDFGDFDGDGLVNEFDPDDDNDDVYDEDDADPFNPNVWDQSQLPTAVPEPVPTTPPTAVPTTAPAPAPAPTTAPVPTAAPQVTEPTPPAENPAQPAPQEPEPAAQAPVAPVPVVAALPETGVGDNANPVAIVLMASVATVVCFGARVLLRNART